MIPVDGAASIAASLLGESRQNKESEREVAVLPENETDIGKSGLVEVEAVRAQFFRSDRVKQAASICTVARCSDSSERRCFASALDPRRSMFRATPPAT